MQNYPDGLEAEHVKKLNTDGEKEGGGADIRSFIIGELHFGGEALGKLQKPVEENGSKEFGDLEPQSLAPFNEIDKLQTSNKVSIESLS